MFDRTKNLLGDDLFNKIQSVNILLVGIGGVGGTTLEALVRIGFVNITIVDKDVFELSNLNRQILCTNDLIGTDKIDGAIRRCLSINSDVNLNAYKIDIYNDDIPNIESFDYIIDAIDDVNAKLILYKLSEVHNIKIISSMGMGNRMDISSLKIGRLDRTKDDPLARNLRFLCKKNNISSKIPVVYSSELPFISKDIYSLITVTSSAGLIIAHYIVNDLKK